MADTNTDQHKFDISFSPTPSPLPAQREAYNKYNTDFTNFLGSQETVPQLQARYENRYMIPDLQERAQRQSEAADYVGNQLRALPTDIATRTANTMLTQGQKNRMIQAEGQPLQNNYNTLQQAANETQQRLGTAEQNLNKAISAEQVQQTKMTTPWLQKYDANTIMNAAENTQWTQSNQWELNRLLANQQAGLTWTNAEAQRAHELSMQENAFHNQLDLLDKQNKMYLDLWS